MNIFTLIGDFLHLASIFIVLVKIIGARNCRGRLSGSGLCEFLVSGDFWA